MAAVDDQTARGAVDRLVELCTEGQRQSGSVTPDVRAAEDFARNVVTKVVQENEARDSQGFKPETPAGTPPDRISRGDVGPDTTVINRPVDLSKPRKQVPQDVRLRSRLEFLGKMPEWDKRITDAALQGEMSAKKMGIYDYTGRMTIVAEHVVNEIDKANLLYGDWRTTPIGMKVK